jgi:hypothetical protein
MELFQLILACLPITVLMVIIPLEIRNSKIKRLLDEIHSFSRIEDLKLLHKKYPRKFKKDASWLLLISNDSSEEFVKYLLEHATITEEDFQKRFTALSLKDFLGVLIYKRTFGTAYQLDKHFNNPSLFDTFTGMNDRAKYFEYKKHRIRQEKMLALD